MTQTANSLPDTLGSLRRPRLLIRAARYALSTYERNRGLERLFGETIDVASRDPLEPLIAREAEMEHSRQSGDAHYSVSRHIEILVALMAEARLQLQAHEA